MASVVDICNLALSHIGDPGQITDISPPDGSKQAALCSRFYPLARRVFNEGHDWSFATRRVTLADLNDPTGAWDYRYAIPSDSLRVSKVLSALTESDEPSVPFLTEVDDNGDPTILTNMEEATCVYVFDQTDTTRFGPMAEHALSRLLASYLAGPLIKGKAGETVSDSQFQKYVREKSAAATADASQHKQDRTDRKPRSIQARQ